MLNNKKLRNFLYWIVAGIFIFLFIFLLVKLYPFYSAVFSFIWRLFAPFLIACLIAYLLHPIVKKLQQFNFPKPLAILLIYFLFFGGGIYLAYRFYPTFMGQIKDLYEHLPNLIEMYEAFIYQIYDSTAYFPETVHEKIDQVIRKIEEDIEQFLGIIIGGVTKLFDMVVLITVIPVLVFYFLKDYKLIKVSVKKRIPKKYRKQCSHLVNAIDKSLGDYIRGQFLVCLFVSLATYIAFDLLGIKYPLLLAIIIGLTNIIPYFGPIIGAIPAIAIAITMSGKMVIYSLIVIFAVQLIEGNLLSPYIVGKATKLHPVAIIFVLLLGGQLSGVLGMIVAVPLLTILKVITNHMYLSRTY